ncbi:hypothetical protein ACC808_07690 [Rhizobium ruizarguesonis]
MPIHDPCALLNRLLQERNESAWLEFKVNNKDPREIGARMVLTIKREIEMALRSVIARIDQVGRFRTRT